MSRVVVLALLAVLAACREPKFIAVVVVAAGWEDEPPKHLLGPNDCTPLPDDPVITVSPDGHWHATRSGATVVPCSDGEIRFRATAIATMSITAPASVVSDADTSVNLHAFGIFGEELQLDDSVQWTATGSVAPPRPHNDMDFIGPAIAMIKAPQLHHFRAGLEGTIDVSAQWHDRSAGVRIAVRHD